MSHRIELCRAVHRVALLSTVVGLAAAIGLAAPANAQVPSVCVQNNSNYYCYYTGTSRGGSSWAHNSSWSGSIHSYPSFLWDDVRSWDSRRTSGWVVLNYNWHSGLGVWQWVFSMPSNFHDSNQPDLGDAGADALEVFWTG